MKTVTHEELQNALFALDYKYKEYGIFFRDVLGDYMKNFTDAVLRGENPDTRKGKPVECGITLKSKPHQTVKGMIAFSEKLNEAIKDAETFVYNGYFVEEESDTVKTVSNDELHVALYELDKKYEKDGIFFRNVALLREDPVIEVGIGLACIAADTVEKALALSERLKEAAADAKNFIYNGYIEER